MTWFGWLKGKNSGHDSPLAQWRAAWAAAVAGSEEADAELRRQFDTATVGQPDVELETEMLDALDQLRDTQRRVKAGELPAVETHHRVIGSDICHFSAPASLPTDQGQASGRVLLTGSKAVFVGGGRTSATAWHMVHQLARIERDVLLARPDGSPAAHFRFNTYADALVCAFLAAELRGQKRRVSPSIIAR
jgi:hypothetical protein